MRRHAEAHLPAKLVQATKATEVAEAGALLGRVERLVGDLQAMADSARDEGDRDVYLMAS